ncbi:MAG: VOC family protein [Gammaproteobacteria bacterium]
MPLQLKSALAAALIAILIPAATGAQSFTHIHLRAPDAAAAAEWYQTLLGGVLRPSTAGMGSVGQAHGAIATMLDDGSAARSRGGVIDHFGFAVPNVATTLERAQVMGARMITAPTPGVVTTAIAMIEDPWGTRIELLESQDFRGIQHIHLVTEQPAALRDWFLQVFGGDFDPAHGGDELNTIQYDGIWIYISESFSTVETAGREDVDVAEIDISPSRGRSLDHLGFSVDDMDALVSRVRASGYTPYETRPNRPGGTTLLMFFEGPDGVHFEIAEPGGVQP